MRCAHGEQSGTTRHDLLIRHSSVAFDLTITPLWGTLTSGGALHVVRSSPGATHPALGPIRRHRGGLSPHGSAGTSSRQIRLPDAPMSSSRSRQSMICHVRGRGIDGLEGAVDDVGDATSAGAAKKRANPPRHSPWYLREESRGLTQDLLLLAEDLVLTAQPGQFVLLGAGQAVGAAAVIEVGLAHPDTDRLRGGLKLLGEFLRRPSRAPVPPSAGETPADGCSAQWTPSFGNQGSPEIRCPPNRVNSTAPNPSPLDP
jgi:hypothetical protein